MLNGSPLINLYRTQPIRQCVNLNIITQLLATLIAIRLSAFSLSFNNLLAISKRNLHHVLKLLKRPVQLKIIFHILFLIPFWSNGQQINSIKIKSDSLKEKKRVVISDLSKPEVITQVIGRVVDAASGQPLYGINIRYINSEYGTSSDKEGKFNLSAKGAFNHILFSYIGYLSIIQAVKPGQKNEFEIRLKSAQTQLKEVSISGKGARYRNKGNPAVALIQQVIDHKDQNRMESSAYLQYEQYERIGLSFFDLPAILTKSRIFNKYKFMLDTGQIINGQARTSLPVYFSEKLFKNYYRKNPSKSIQILEAQNQINIVKFIDTAGVDIYLNRLYGNNIDIYSNNIFIITNQFLSPIADHSPDFYKFYIIDTLQTDKGKLVELNFTPRNKGDLLFEGKLTITLDGHYAVESCELSINKQININFMRSLLISLDFSRYQNGRYYLQKSDVKADFGILKAKGPGVFGERTVYYSNYKLNEPLADEFYKGKSIQAKPNANLPDTSFWKARRPDTLTRQQAAAYSKINRLERMRSFKIASWIANTFAGNYADLGPVQFGQISDFFSFDNVEGARFQIGARTTPKFNRSFYFDTYTGYGTMDKKLKYNVSTYLSLNHLPFYMYPNDYLKLSYQYDISIPGQNFSINTNQPPLSSFQSGTSDYFLYSKVFKVDYVKEFENHFSFDLALKNWNQQAAGSLVYRLNDVNHTLVDNLTTSEVSLDLRYAPHEQIIQGTTDRTTIYSKYPIIRLQIRQGIKNVGNGSYSFTNINATLAKRFYLSQLGYTDVTLLGSLLIGTVPFPLLNISTANQSVAYDPDAYNKMYYLEFVSDHYAGLNITQSFNGFFLNKIPLIKQLKWREYLSFKALYGGLRNENNPLYSNKLYLFPTGNSGINGTYALGNIPYIEAGAGIGNIFKFLRIDMIKRFNYLDHPGISAYGIKISFSPDF